jgi:ATP synthase in type III secretion protein N
VIALGRVVGIDGGLLVARLPRGRIGESVRLANGLGGEVRSIDGGLVRVAIHGSTDGIAAGTQLRSDRGAARMHLGTCALGRVIDARGAPLDAGPPLLGATVRVETGAPVQRAAVTQPFWTGVRAIDALLTLGAGSRVGIFGAPGTGKSMLLEMLARGSTADAVVVALVGERGREAHAWAVRCDRRATVVSATSDRPAAERLRAARVALSHARALRDRGLHVLVLLDSLARVATALRELGVANGETAGRGGFPPSVFAELARLIEVCGATPRGSITLVATILDDGDERDPISDAARSLLDGHLQLSLDAARRGRFPALDVPASASRTMASVVDADHARAARRLSAAIAALQRTADARDLGIASADEGMRRAVACEERIDAFLRQEAAPSGSDESRAMLLELASAL